LGIEARYAYGRLRQRILEKMEVRYAYGRLRQRFLGQMEMCDRIWQGTPTPPIGILSYA